MIREIDLTNVDEPVMGEIDEGLCTRLICLMESDETARSEFMNHMRLAMLLCWGHVVGD